MSAIPSPVLVQLTRIIAAIADRRAELGRDAAPLRAKLRFARSNLWTLTWGAVCEEDEDRQTGEVIRRWTGRYPPPADPRLYRRLDAAAYNYAPFANVIRVLDLLESEYKRQIKRTQVIEKAKDQRKTNKKQSLLFADEADKPIELPPFPDLSEYVPFRSGLAQIS